ncbi:15195_t:CDS:1, partial [Funneliformis geosporum]
MLKRKRVVLSAAQKKELCEIKEKNLGIFNVKLSEQYHIGKSTVTDILHEKERWLIILEGQENVKKFRSP